MVYQKPEALILTNSKLHNEHLQVKLFGQKGIYTACYTAVHNAAKINEEAL